MTRRRGAVPEAQKRSAALPPLPGTSIPGAGCGAAGTDPRSPTGPAGGA